MANTAGAADVKFTITAQDNATAVLSRLDANFRNTSTSVARFGVTGREGLRKFENALTNLALANVGVTGTFGKLVEGASLLAVGSSVMLPVVAGLAAIGIGLRLINKDAREAKEELARMTDQLLRAADARSGQTLATQFNTTGREKNRLQTLLDAGGTYETISAGTGGRGTQVFRAFSAEKRAQLQQQINDQVKAQAEVLRQMQERAIAALPPKDRAAMSAAARLDRLVREALFPLGVQTSQDIIKAPIGIRTGAVPDLNQGGDVPIPPFFTDWQERILSQVEDEFAPDLAGAINNAFTRAFSGEGIGGLIKGFGQVILAQLGDLFIRMGTALVGFGKIMAGIQKALMNVLTSGPAAVIAGVALIALGAGLNAIASGGGGGGGRGFSAPRGFSGGGFSESQSLFAGQRGASTIINVHGGPVIDLRDHETRDQLAAVGVELRDGTRQSVQVNHVRRV